MATGFAQDPNQLTPEELDKRIAELQAELASPKEDAVTPSEQEVPATESVTTTEESPVNQEMSSEELDARIAALQQELSTPVEKAPIKVSPAKKDTDAVVREGAEAEEEETDFWGEVGSIAGDIGLQTLSGAREGLISLSHTILPLYGIDPETLPKPREMFDAPEGTSGAVAKEISRFVTGYTVGGAPLKGVGAVVNGSKYLKALVEGSTRGFVGDYAVTEAKDKTLSTLIKENGADNFVTNALAINDGDTKATIKFKGALEGVVMGTTLSSVFQFGVKPAVKATTTALSGDGKKLANLMDDELSMTEEMLPRYETVVTDSGNIAIQARPQRSGQQVMDDMQTLQIQDTVDRKMKLLAERRAVYDENKKLFEPMKTGDSLATRREIGQDSNVIKMELKANKKEIKDAEKALEDITFRLENAPILDSTRAKNKAKGIITEETPRIVPKAIITGFKAEGATAPTRAVIQAQGNGIYQELYRGQQQAVKKLDTLHKEKLRLSENLINNQYLKRELTEDAQAAAALRNKEALAIKGPLPPTYEEITLEDLTPIAARIDPSTKARAPRKVAQPLQRLSPDDMKRPLPQNEWDAVSDDVFHKPRPVERIQRALRAVGSMMILRSADSMKSLAEVSPTAARLANMLRFDTSPLARKEGQYSFTESAQFLSGKYKTRMKDALSEGLEDSDFTQFGNLTKEANKNIVRYLRGVDIDNIPQKYQAVGANIRKALTDFHGESGEEVTAGFINNFFPRKWKAGDMYKNKEVVRQKLTAAGYSPKRIQVIERKLINEMQEDLGIEAAIARGNDFSWRGSKLLSEGSRSLEIDELSFEDFLSNDVINVLDDYFEKGARKITYNDMFGYGGQKVKAMLADILTESRANGRPIQEPERKAIEALLRNVQGMQKHGSAIDPINETVGTAMRVMHLGMATLISFGEAFIPFGKAGFLQASKGLVKAVTAVPQHYVSKVLKGVPEPEAYAAAQRVNLALTAAAAERLSSLMGNEVMHATTRKINNAYFKGTLLTEWVKMVQVAAFNTGRSVIIDNLAVLHKGGSKIPGRNALLRDELTSLGVDVEAGLKWMAGGKDTKHPFMEMIDRGSLRFANDSALQPDSTVKPFIQSRPEAMLLTQFKAYPTAFANVVLRDYANGLTGQGVKGAVNKAYKIGTKAVRATVATTMILGATGYGKDLREYIQYGEAGNPYDAEKTDYDRFLDIADASGMLGHAALVKHAYDADRYNQDPILSWFGPSYGKAFNLVRAAVDEDNRQDILAKEAARSIPNFLPTEILLRLNNPDGSKAAREELRAAFSKPEAGPERVESEKVTPERVIIKGKDLDLWDTVRTVYPDEYKELLNNPDDEDGEDAGEGSTIMPDQAKLDEYIRGLSIDPDAVPQLFSSAAASPESDLAQENGIFSDTGITSGDFYATYYNAEHTQEPDVKKSAKILAAKKKQYEDAQSITVLPKATKAIDKAIASGAFSQEMEERGITAEQMKSTLEAFAKVESSGGRTTMNMKSGASGILQVIPSTFRSMVSNKKVIGDKSLKYLKKTRKELEAMTNGQISRYLASDMDAGALFGLAAVINLTKGAGVSFNKEEEVPEKRVEEEKKDTAKTPDNFFNLTETSDAPAFPQKFDDPNFQEKDAGISKLAADVADIKKAFPDATLEEIQEFLKEQRDVNSR